MGVFVEALNSYTMFCIHLIFILYDNLYLSRLEREIFALERIPIIYPNQSADTTDAAANSSDIEPHSTITNQDQEKEEVPEDKPTSTPKAAEAQAENNSTPPSYHIQMQDVNKHQKSSPSVSTIPIAQETPDVALAPKSPFDKVNDLASSLSHIENFRRCSLLASKKNEQLLHLIAKSDRVIAKLMSERDGSSDGKENKGDETESLVERSSK